METSIPLDISFHIKLRRFYSISLTLKALRVTVLWCTKSDEAHGGIYFHFRPSRKRAIALEIFMNFHSPLSGSTNRFPQRGRVFWIIFLYLSRFAAAGEFRMQISGHDWRANRSHVTVPWWCRFRKTLRQQTCPFLNPINIPTVRFKALHNLHQHHQP